MKRFALFPSVCLLLCASVAPLYAGIPPVRWLPAKPVKITSVNATLQKATANLARVVIPGYANFLSKKTGRDVLAEKGSLGMNMHQAISLHEFFFPENVGKLLPPEFNLLPDIEKNTPEYIEDTYLHWERPSGKSRVFLLESALPAYLAEPSGEEIFIPSAEQLEEALAFYREVLGAGGNSGLPYSGKFAGAMSAVSNLSLLGNAQDAPLILYAAQKDFESSNKFVDYFVIRALVALNAKEELKELADYRVEKLERNKQLPAVWRGVNEMYKLDIEDDLIAQDSETMPDFMQKGLIMHHPFNYVLLNPSKNVTSQWVDLRAGIQEQFKTALAQEPAPQADEKLAQAAVQEKRFVFNEPVARTSEAAITPVQEKPALDLNIVLYQTDKLLRKALYEDRANRAAIQQAIKEELRKEKASSSLTNQEIVLPAQRAKPQTKAEIRQALENYIAEHNALPPATSKLYGQIFTIARNISSSKDPDGEIITQLYNQYRMHKNSSPEGTLEELRTYLSENNNTLPPYNSALRVRVQNFLRKKTKDPYIEEMKILWEAHKAPTHPTVRNTPAHIRERLEQYLAETHNMFPPSGTSFRTIIGAILRKSDPNDPDVQAIRALHQQFAVHSNAAPAKKPEQWLAELEAFLEQNERLPSSTAEDPSERKLAIAVVGIRRRSVTAKKFNEAAQKIVALLNDHKYYKVTNIQNSLENLKAFLAKEGRLPSTDSPNREERLLAEKMYDIRAKVLRGINTDEASLEVAFIVEQYRMKGKKK